MNNEFLDLFREELAKYIIAKIPGVNPRHVRWFVDYYASEEKLSFQQMAEMEEDIKTDNGIGKPVRGIREKLDNTNIGGY